MSFQSLPDFAWLLVFAAGIVGGCGVNTYARRWFDASRFPFWVRIVVTHIGFLPLTTVTFFVAGLSFERVWWHTITRDQFDVTILLTGTILLALALLDVSLTRPEWMKSRRRRIVRFPAIGEFALQ